MSLYSHASQTRISLLPTLPLVPVSGSFPPITADGSNSLSIKISPSYINLNNPRYIEIDNINKKTVVISDGYCSDYETELNFNFSVNVDNTYFTYRENTESKQYLDYINLNVNNASSSNIIHYLFDYNGDHYEIYRWRRNCRKRF